MEGDCARVSWMNCSLREANLALLCADAVVICEAAKLEQAINTAAILLHISNFSGTANDTARAIDDANFVRSYSSPSGPLRTIFITSEYGLVWYSFGGIAPAR